jgi:hypothetical protein
MEKILMACIVGFLMVTTSYAQEKLKWSPFLQQAGLFHAGDGFTTTGYGFGFGANMNYKRHIVFQPDINLFMGNAYAVSNRFALGYQKNGKWCPAVLGTMNVLWGRPSAGPEGPVTDNPLLKGTLGVRISPLRFETPQGFVSFLELGYGIGKSRGRFFEMTLIKAGIGL